MEAMAGLVAFYFAVRAPIMNYTTLWQLKGSAASGASAR